MKTIYLAIPYTNMEESSYKQSIEVVGRLSKNENLVVFSPIIHSHIVAKKSNISTDAATWWTKNKRFLKFSDELWVIIPKEGYKIVANSPGVQQEIEYFRRGLKRPVKYLFWNDTLPTRIKSTCFQIPLKDTTFTSIKNSGYALVSECGTCNELLFHIDDILHFIRTRDKQKYPMDGKDVQKILTLKSMGISTLEFINLLI
jgi:hypothetical protein